MTTEQLDIGNDESPLDGTEDCDRSGADFAEHEAPDDETHPMGLEDEVTALDVERAYGDFHREVDAFADELRGELSAPEALESFNREMDALARFKAPGFDDVMRLTEAGAHPAVIRTGRALARRVLQLEAELAAIRQGAGDDDDARSRQSLEDEWRDLRNKADYWTNPAVQRRSREIAEALYGTDPVGAGSVRTAVGVNSHRDGV